MGIEDKINKLHPEHKAEVIDFIEFLMNKEAGVPEKQGSLQKFLDESGRRTRKVRSKEELDREIAQERSAWEPNE